MKINIILWGTGKTACKFEHFVNYQKVVIVLYIDNDKKVRGGVILPKNEIKLVPVISPDMIDGHIEKNTLIVIVSSYYTEIREQLKKLPVDNNQIINGYNILERKYDERLKDILLPNYFSRANQYEIEGIKFDLGMEHSLPQCKREFLMYDAFIPYLGMLEERISEMYETIDHWIIDIGANVGDTTFGMIKNTSANFIAVEPTQSFFELLNKNINAIDAKYSCRIKTIQAYISDDEKEKFKSIKNNGSAVKSKCDNAEAPTITIKSLLKKCNIKQKEVRLIKVDTDGFDAECIMSCGKILKDIDPLLYWENEIDNNEQYKKSIQLCEYLLECNYIYYFMFDNFGNFIGCIDNNALRSINGYLARINSCWGTRTFYYVDVLACKERQKEDVEKIVDQYLRNYPIERLLPTI